MPKMQWEGKFGPAFIGVVVQTLVIAVTGVAFLVHGSDDAANSKAAVVELKAIVVEMQKANAAEIERLAKVETTLGFLGNSLQRVEMKLDAKSDLRR